MNYGNKTVLFVCPHGAGKSRMAAAWFNGAGLPNWSATTAGIEPQTEVSAHAGRLLAGTPVEALLDQALPRPISAVPQADLVVAIDCENPLEGAVAWRLVHSEFDDAMCAEIRDRVTELVATLR
ncbi:hypothetical protein SK571_03785 [Lentzea sp. BCCO 10_0798]|uniref:Phosphotyrosine protein phosphatase I domain-containing protein n=1 Tax=Lentzea kristufekii TaxID=3095430 RepID=A0ABU4TKP3_9PSEU|nr:hypothetical protein [Lentzea sp. BCCO 10_0798]MDX8048492.1 hypothetical protein [Lentzea sp. BCCO 10_0798]